VERKVRIDHFAANSIYIYIGKEESKQTAPKLRSSRHAAKGQ